jgi:molybdenum cofactor synthesis domain-containing protein
MAAKFAFDHPDDALRALASKLNIVDIENSLTARSAVGRVLAENVIADRDSPAADVSAMDGYAIRMSNLNSENPVAVSGKCVPGAPAPEMPVGSVLRIFTGAIVPTQCEAVVKREDTEELEDSIRFLKPALSSQPGEHIRRAGENIKVGSVVLSSGIELNAAHMATMENFGCVGIDVHQPVRVSVVTTGDEVGDFCKEPPEPWQLRNSNRTAIWSLLNPKPWISAPESGGHIHCQDDRQTLTDTLSKRLADSDAVILTGGVSMGDYDYVPDVVREVGGEIVFHGLPIRPGKPILGAATADGKLILGLPGNPVSATIGCRRMAMPLLAKMSGQTNWLPNQATSCLENAGDKTIPLHWLRLARFTNHGTVEAVQSQGSGDLVSLGHSDGFIELPPGASGDGPWPLYRW